MTNATLNTMTAAPAAPAAPERNKDIPAAVLIASQAKVFKSGGTLIDLMMMLDDKWETYTEEQQKKRLATVNVSRSQAKKRYIGNRTAIRSDLLKRLAEAGDDAGEVSNAIRTEIREHDRKVTSMLATWKLNRRGRSGGSAGVDFGDLVENAIADAVLGDVADDMSDIDVE
jgi:hypothetical protein